MFQSKAETPGQGTMHSWNTRSGYRIIQVLAGRSNVFVITNDQCTLLVDTSPKYKRTTLKNWLAQLKIEHIDYCIVTHTHFDHAANAGWIKSTYGARLIVHSSEAEILRTGKNVFPYGTNAFTKALINILGRQIESRFNFDPCQSDITVDSHYDLRSLGFNAYIMHTPEHSFGCISIVIDNEIAIVGDAMFGIFKWSVFPPFADDVKEMIRSWGKLLETGCTTFLPSHGTENGKELLQKCYNKEKIMLNKNGSS